jgi:Mn2+/Fe2+ NRAMP family transporter
MVPLLQFTSSRKRMGAHANGWFLNVAGWGACVLITLLDVYGLWGMLFGKG